MDLVQAVKSLNLPKNSFIVVGSGILATLGIREAKDIDLIVSQSVFSGLAKEGWATGQWEDQPVLINGVIEVGTMWAGESVDKLLVNATFIGGIPYVSLDDIKNWKLQKGRPKDIVDVALINEYQKKGSE